MNERHAPEEWYGEDRFENDGSNRSKVRPSQIKQWPTWLYTHCDNFLPDAHWLISAKSIETDGK